MNHAAWTNMIMKNVDMNQHEHQKKMELNRHDHGKNMENWPTMSMK